MIALIEDEKEKALALKDALQQAGFLSEEVCQYESVRDAVLAVESQDFKLVVLDVSLPTFSPSGMTGSAGRAQQQSGGLEVLRALMFAKKAPKVIIVTQYPDIIFGDESVKLQDVSGYARRRYEQNVVGAVLYREADSVSWRNEFKKALGEVK